MRKRACKTITIYFLMNFLLWLQLGAAQWVCQCDHASLDQSCHIPQNNKADDNCCTSPESVDSEEPAAVSSTCHAEMAASSEENASSCCSEINQSGAPATAYSTPAYFCQTACLSLVTAQSKEVLLREPLKKGRELPLASESVLRDRAITRVPANIVFQESSLLLHSPPLFLMHSSFLI